MENNTIDSNMDQFVEGVQNNDSETITNQSVKYETSMDPEVLKELKSSQSLLGAILGGFIGAIAGAAVWAIITAATKYEIGYIAIAVGFLTGFMVRKLGHGYEKHYGYIGALWSFLGCFLGNILALLIMVSDQSSIPLMTLLASLYIDDIIMFVQSTFDIMDLLFYGIALYEGYKFSFMTKDEITKKLNKIVNSNNQQNLYM